MPQPVLPAEFVWGAATAAYQVEGAVAEDGRTPSIWDTFSHTPGKVDGGDTGDVACDSYHRWPDDLAALRALGVGAYRFSVAWPRIQPQPGGALNPAGLAYYDRMVDDLLATGIRPMVTLYHWDLPQYLQDAGGWPARATAERFADYAGLVAARLGDRVQDWVTLNEPLCSAWLGHLEGVMAPGDRDLSRAVPTSVHLLLAHGLGTQAVRAAAPLPARVGLVCNLSPCEPATASPEDAAAAVRADGHTNRWWLDPVHGRGFPQDMAELYAAAGSGELPLRDGDLDTIAEPMDFLGVNYYFRNVVADDPAAGVVRARQVEVPGAATTAMGWEVHADGLRDILVRVAEDYAPSAVVVTENGSAWVDEPGPDGRVEDAERTAYLEAHLAACAEAVERGVPLEGYYAWSLLDNFEWAYGYDKRFGLVRVDYPTGTRTVKASGERYAQIIAAHRGDVAPLAVG
ncbi:beta-glucosidase [Motilibacter rhizosphaerae]|uniref:Beta-glucosidase n=1 Tax=Motilibacter rhizosphaerae TaxID=598652 RepID=A0A4Q7NVI6_9ACTN|nr:GH1 family beta-glucosidase [Motilibacter rhizosphaerae]RZS91261.1 beta-glucosidase [Motilibacter rhizosphaerae]